MDDLKKALRLTQKMLFDRWQHLVGQPEAEEVDGTQSFEQNEQEVGAEQAPPRPAPDATVRSEFTPVSSYSGADRLARITQDFNKPNLQSQDPWMQAIDLCTALNELAHSLIVSSAVPNCDAIELTEPRRILEPNQVLKADIGSISVKPQSFCRWRATTGERSLCVRARPRLIELFIVPGEEYNLLSYAEFGSRFRGKIELIDATDGPLWLLNKKPLLTDDAIALIKSLLSSLSDDAQVQQAPRRPPEAQWQAQNQGAANLSDFEKQNLIYRLLNQEEQFKRRVARDLHDTVLADLMTLKRSIVANQEQELDMGELIDMLNQTIQKLRDVCNEYGPQHLRDWGLTTSLEDMIDRLEERTGMDCRISCEIDIPDLPDMVETNVFRILQECLNNVEKYSKARRVDVVIEQKGTLLRFCVSDDGVGFEKGALSSVNPLGGGMGMESMRQRAELIRCFFPATLAIDSAPGKGTRTTLEINLPEGSG
jgi:signal transduction histidine kinase